MSIHDDAGPGPAQYETILRTIRDGVYTVDANGRITWVNDTVLEDFDIGYDREELIGSPVSIVLDQGDIERCTEIILRCLDEGRSSGRCEVTFRAADGRAIPCELHLALLPTEDGEFRGTVGVIREITERKRREQMLQVLNRLLRHNLRNDMNVVLGRAELVEETVNGETAEHARTIRRVGEDLVDLAAKIRWLAELDELPDPRPVPLDVTDRLSDIIATIEADYPNVSVTLDAAVDDVIALRVGRESVLDLVLGEILENSVIHNDRDAPRIEVGLEEDQHWLRVIVSDNGPGLPGMEREVVERGVETPLEHGSGIGLWLVHWALITVGGEITFPDDDGGGTTIELRLPRE